MLADITISDLGVISSASAELSSGLTVLTGETGAGKTMVVTGLRLLAGGRADASRVRAGAKRAVVEGTFITDELSTEDAQRIAEIVDTAGGVADENGEYVAARTVMSTGRSKAHLGGRTVPAATLNEFSRSLLTVHGQNDQLRLLAPDQQLAALDRSSSAIAPLVEKYRSSFVHWRSLAKDLKRRTESRRELAQEVDRLQFAVNEISQLDPQPGEDEELISLIKRLQDVDGLREAAQSALVAIDGVEGDFEESKPASTLLGEAHAALHSIDDSQLGELSTQIGEMTSQLAGIAGELGQFLSELPADPALLEKSLQRQQELRGLTRKYAGDIDGVLAWKEDAEARLQSMDTSTEAIEQLQAQVAEAQADMVAKAEKLTAARAKAAKQLAKAVTEEIHGLAMPKARLEVELLLAANDAATPKPLSVAASGGELSRVMLALEVILSAGTAGTTLVFDEVDAGVGGRAAVEIGRRLARLAQANQVIVVTHLPQVAAYADTHLHVAKDVSDTSVTSGVITLSKEERVEELARMLAGLDDTATGRAHASELLSKAQEEVEGFRA